MEVEGRTAIQAFAGIEMIWCPPGTFLMGSPAGEPERRDDEIQHEVTLTQGFWLGKYPVTQAQWEEVMGENPSDCKGDDLPVEYVSWDDCQEFLSKLNAQGEGEFRLPTESEWEYACRAGTATPFCFGNAITPEQVNYDGNSPYAGGAKGEYRGETTPVGHFPPNAWGLHDMHGNVFEWCQDWFGNYPTGAVTDPMNPESTTSRVLRGGSWNSKAKYCRSAYRRYRTPDRATGITGVRILRTP